MNTDARELLEISVKKITETGEWMLNKDLLKTIKHHCKHSPTNVEITYQLIMAQLHKKHSQIRYSCLQLCEELFQRSHGFRLLLAEDFPTFLQLGVGTRDQSLPPPIANKLRPYAIALVKNWYERYGEHLRPLGIAYDYLDHNGFLDQTNDSLQAIHTRDREKSSKEARIKAIQERRYDQIKLDISDHLDLVLESIKSMESCFEILIPKNIPTVSSSSSSPLDFNALMQAEPSDKGDNYKEAIVSHGLGSNRYSITIDMSEPVVDQVHESEENQVVYEQLREAYKVLETKQIKKVNDWINALVKMEYIDTVEKKTYIKQLIQAKNDISEAIRKVKLLGIELPSDHSNNNNTDDYGDDDDDYLDELFEDVELPQPGTSEPPSEHTMTSTKLPPAQRLFPLAYEPGMTEDVTYSGGQVQLLTETSIDQQTSSDNKGKGKEKDGINREDLLKRAPVVEWGDDLYYWDKKNVQFNTSGIEFSHRFMGTGEGIKEMPDHLLDDLRKRSIYYKPTLPEKIKACRYPLHNGGLCPRRDLVTCPFHGKIIPRDELGRPSSNHQPSSSDNNPSSSSSSHNRSSSSSNHSSIPLWEEIEGQVMQQAGQDRIIPGQKRRKKETKTTALIDVRKEPDTTYTRLQRKIDSTRKLVDEAQDYERELKYRDRKASTWR
ncbi:hypothetical protein BC941DRAFT_431491 [Chlamydoabsidia padenii]|nr:hypothetical protein BC941DRAFT_431491 [Chlamydoabsidia padenii]